MINRIPDDTARPAASSIPARAKARGALPLLLGPLLAAGGLGTTPDAGAVGDTALVSVNSRGKQANGNSGGASLSADGRFVAFYSGASNLVPGDTNGTNDVFVRDRQTQQTTRVSVDSAGRQGNADSGGSAISGNGRFVAFVSRASNLVRGDTNGKADVFVHDRKTRRTTRVSVASNGHQAHSEMFFAPSISANGRFVAFDADAADLVPGDDNASMDVFVHDRQSRQTTRVSVSASGIQANGFAGLSHISAHGRFIAFASAADNLVPGDSNGAWDVFVHDRATHQTNRVSVDSLGRQGNADSFRPFVSADGRIVAFLSDALNLMPPGTNLPSDIFVHDRRTHQTTRVVADSHGSSINPYLARMALSADGRFVAFGSDSSNLVPGDTNGMSDIFVHDRRTHATTRVSVATDGQQANFFSLDAAMSADGRFVAFSSWAGNLVPGDTNNAADIFVRDRLLDPAATADLAVTQTVSPSPFLPSSPITYTVKVINKGPDPAGEVTLADGPLRGAAVPSQGNCSTGAPMVCYLGNLAARASATVTLTLPPRSIGTTRVYNAARVNAAPVDPNVANNRSGLHASVAP